MKYYAVIDTNVVVSAMLKWDSIPGKVMDAVFYEVTLKEGKLKTHIL